RDRSFDLESLSRRGRDRETRSRTAGRLKVMHDLGMAFRVTFGRRHPAYGTVRALRLFLRKPTIFALLRWSSAGWQVETWIAGCLARVGWRKANIGTDAMHDARERHRVRLERHALRPAVIGIKAMG